METSITKKIEISIWTIPFGYLYSLNVPLELKYNGYIEMENFDRDECWHLCNWTCWSREGQPSNLFSDIGHANSDIIFQNTSTNECHLAISNGWHVENSFPKMVALLNWFEKQKNQLKEDKLTKDIIAQYQQLQLLT